MLCMSRSGFHLCGYLFVRHIGFLFNLFALSPFSSIIIGRLTGSLIALLSLFPLVL
jgi:hypothetical protein